MSCVVCYLAGSTKLLVGWHLGEVVHSTKSVVKKKHCLWTHGLLKLRSAIYIYISLSEGETLK